MTNDRRKNVYARQNGTAILADGTVKRLTGAQRRRLRKNANRGA